jgi:chromosome segregation ATPase
VRIPEHELEDLRVLQIEKEEVKKLQAELEKRRKEIADRDEELLTANTTLKDRDDELKQVKMKLKKLEQEKEKADRRIAEQDAKLNAADVEVKSLKRDNSEVADKLRKLDKEKQAQDARLHRLLEENERFKASLKDFRGGEKDRDADARKEKERLEHEVKTLIRQRGELLGAFRKQMKLIDVLKRQKVHLEAARMLAFTEDEFMRVLELGEKLTA